jgi:ParB-like chromosome segregation protein Spo0J
MIVTDMPVESLVPYARNPRNNTAAIDAVKASIAEFGFRQPIVVDEKLVVIVGHTRLEAAKQLWATPSLRPGPPSSAKSLPSSLPCSAL